MSYNLDILLPGFEGSRYTVLKLVFFSAILSNVCYFDYKQVKTLIFSSGLVIIFFALTSDYLLDGDPGYGPKQLQLLFAGFFVLFNVLILNHINIRPYRVIEGLIFVYNKKLRGKKSLILVMLMIFMGGHITNKAWHIGLETFSPEKRANYAAQLWARNNTLENSVFIVYAPGDTRWRTVSKRLVLNPSMQRLYVYSQTKTTKKFDDQIIDFYGLNDDFREASFNMRRNHYYEKESQAYFGLNENEIIRLANSFTGDYVVRKHSNTLNFQEVYRNNYFIIYKLPV